MQVNTNTNNSRFNPRIYSVFLLLLGIVLSPLMASAQDTVPVDVDSLGNIWIVTLDNTFSMYSRSGNTLNMTLEGQNVASRLKKSVALCSVNWKTDRFLFFNSGINIQDVKHVDTKFIQHTDSCLHQFSGISQFVNYVGARIEYNNYRNYQSFVSQMRLLSLKKGIEFMQQKGESANYRDIMVLTISDDAVDQHDQWSTDYRTLKKAAPDKVVLLSNIMRKYIYNPLNGWGGGELNLVWSDEGALPFLWIYRYETAEGRRLADSAANILQVTARDGKSIHLKLHSQEPLPCMCRVDSLKVNGRTILAGRYFSGECNIDSSYNNGFLHNDVTIYGKAQVEYFDSILGNHYRVVDFVQHTKVLPQHIVVISRTLLGITIAAALLALIFFGFVLPRLVLFDVFDATGIRHRVRRGYRWQWGGRIIPLLTLFSSRGVCKTVLFRQDAKVSCQRASHSQYNGDKILVASRFNVELPVANKCYNTAEGHIDNKFFNHSEEDYPALLRENYHRTKEYNYYIKSKSRSAITRWYYTALLWLRKVVIGPLHYYYLTVGGTLVSMESSLLPGTLFLLENGGAGTKAKVWDDDAKMQQLLHHYYTNHELKGRNRKKKVIIFLSRSDNSHTWDVVRTEQMWQSRVSLTNIEWVYHYTVSGGSVTKEYKQLKQYIRRKLHCSPFCVAVSQQHLIDIDQPTYFNIEKSHYMSFLSLISTEEDSVATQIYDPFTDGRNNSIQFLIRTNKRNKRSTNHLYDSFLPINKLPDDCTEYKKQLSTELVSFIGNDQVSELVIDNPNELIIGGKQYTIK